MSQPVHVRPNVSMPMEDDRRPDWFEYVPSYARTKPTQVRQVRVSVLDIEWMSFHFPRKSRGKVGASGHSAKQMVCFGFYSLVSLVTWLPTETLKWRNIIAVWPNLHTNPRNQLWRICSSLAPCQVHFHPFRLALGPL